MPAIDPSENRAAPKAKKRTPKLKKSVVKQQKAKDKDFTLTRRTPDQADRKRLHPTAPRKPTPVAPDRQDERDRSPQQKQRDVQVRDTNVKESRKKALGKRRAGSGPRFVKKLLDGAVQLNANTVVSTGTGPTVPTIQRKGKGGGLMFAAMEPPVPRAIHVDDKNIGGRFVQDITNFPAQAPAAFYQPIAAGVEAAQGDTSRAKKLLKDFDEQDPIFNAVMAGYEAATGDKKAANKRLDQAKKAASEHPGNLALEVAGAKGAAGRGAGRAVRGTAKVTGSEKLEQLGSTERAPKTQPGTTLEEQRSYSPDLGRKARQVATDKTRRRLSRKAIEQARRATDPGEKQRLEQKARRLDPDRLRDRDIARRVNEHVDTVETVRRAHRAETVGNTRRLIKDAESGGPLVNLLTQRIVKPDVADIREYVRELKAQHDRTNADGEYVLSRSQRRANLELRQDIEKALKDVERGKVDLDRVDEIAREYADVSREGQAGLVERGMLDAEQADKAALMPSAIRRGARHTDEHNRAAAIRAKEIRDNVQSRVDRLEREREQIKGRHRSERSRDAMKEPQLAHYVGQKRFDTLTEAAAHIDEHGGKVRTVALTRKEADRMGERAKVERALRSARDELTAASADHRAAHARRNVAELVDENDKPLSAARIRERMREDGEPEPAFVSQAANARGARNFYVNSGRPPQATGARRTGEATRKGTFSADPETLVEQAARSRGLADSFDHFREFIDENGYRDPNGRGGIKTRRNKSDADKLARDLSEGDTDWVAVRINPFSGSKAQLERMLDDDTDPRPFVDSVDSALKGEDGPGPWAIVTKAAAERLREHNRMLAPGNAGRAGRAVTSSFRQTVLATSPKWLTQNGIEAGFRTAMARAGIRSYVTGRRVLKAAAKNDPKAAEMLRARATGGGHYGMAQRVAVHTNIDSFTDGAVKDLARIAGAASRAPGARQVVDTWKAYTHWVFNVNKAVEEQFQVALLGKAVRDNLLNDRIRKLTDQAIEEAARGAIERNTATALGREVKAAYGRYSDLSPSEKQLVTLYTPFIAWTRNAMTFVFKTLGRDHPLASAFTNSLIQIQDEWLEEHGIDLFAENNRLPGWLQGSVPGKNGERYKVGAALPFGAFTDLPGTVAGSVLPQVSSSLEAMQGRDWKGKTLRDENGNELDPTQKATYAAVEFLKGTIPALAIERQVSKGPGGQLDSITGRVKSSPRKPKLKKLRRPKSSPGVYDPGTYSGGTYDPAGVYDPNK